MSSDERNTPSSMSDGATTPLPLGVTSTASSTPTPAPQSSIANLGQLRVGCKLMVEKDGDYRLSEILSIHNKKGEPVFYVHYEDFNKVKRVSSRLPLGD